MAMPLRTLGRMDPAKLRAMRGQARAFLDALDGGTVPAPRVQLTLV
jgi:hypothetical protein